MAFRYAPIVTQAPLTIRIVDDQDSTYDVAIDTSEILGSELVNGWTNHPTTHPFETLTTSGSDITSAINTSGFGMAYKDIGAVVVGEVYKCVFTTTLNSGTLPYFRSSADISHSDPNNYSSRIVAGANSFYYIITTARDHDYVGWQTGSASEVVDFEVASFSLKKVSGGTLLIPFSMLVGSATTDLLGFYGVGPVDQPATVSDPAGGGTVDTECRAAVASIIDRLQELGLIA